MRTSLHVDRRRPRRSRRALVGALAVAGALTLAACGTSSTGSGGAPSSPGASADSGLAATVASLSQPLSSYPVPTQPLSNVATLKGKTVYYIPITQRSPQFAVTGSALTAALGAVGVSVQVCNGNSNPSQITACVNQATAANAGAIIADAIPYALASNAFSAARAKNIPVLITDQIADPGQPAGPTLGYIEGGGTAMLKAVADWIIVDSKGTAKIVINKSTDSPSASAYVASAQSEFTSHCPQCSVTINEISSANFALIPSSTSAALLKTPGVNYVVSEFDQYLQPTLGGVQQTGKLASIKGVSAAAQLSGLQMVKDKNFLYVEAGQASAYQGWVDADAALRLMLAQSLPEYTIPTRLFTRENIGSVTLTAAAEASGEWYGPTTFPAQFKTLWGLS